jgi:hypothetical protein
MKTDPFYAQFRKDTCFSEGLKKFRKDPCLCFEEAKPNILLIGDSHLAQLSQSLREGFKGVNFLQATAPATLPTVTSYYDKANNYRDMMDFIYHDFIPKNAGKIDGVVISANWAGQRAVGPEGSLKGIKEAISYLKHYNIPVVIIGQTERYTVTYPVVAARAHNSGTPNNTFYLDGYSEEVNGYLASHLKGVYVDVLATEAFPALSSKNEPYMRDKDHFTKYGADLLVARIKENEVWGKFLDGR